MVSLYDNAYCEEDKAEALAWLWQNLFGRPPANATQYRLPKIHAISYLSTVGIHIQDSENQYNPFLKVHVTKFPLLSTKYPSASNGGN